MFCQSKPQMQSAWPKTYIYTVYNKTNSKFVNTSSATKVTHLSLHKLSFSIEKNRYVIKKRQLQYFQDPGGMFTESIALNQFTDLV